MWRCTVAVGRRAIRRMLAWSARPLARALQTSCSDARLSPLPIRLARAVPCNSPVAEESARQVTGPAFLLFARFMQVSSWVDQA